ncbi:MAG TPA: DUF3012 domain-containing protein [Xanthomonadales bacterium]|nr:DUF3012 domain-containing protein [Xanthomonadales bacterium]
MRYLLTLMLLCFSFVVLSGCSPKVGSEAWCADMKMKPKGDWSTNEAGDYLKHCALK